MTQVDAASVQAWLDAYVQAWVTYDAGAIGALFADDAVYYDAPYAEPSRGRDAIVASWLGNRDAPGTYRAHYAPILISGDMAVANGRSYYTLADGTTPRAEFDNVFVLRFDGDGRCVEYREWYMQAPQE